MTYTQENTVIEENVYILVNIYAPNKDKEIIKFLDDLITVIQKENLDEEENFIVGGDFNCPLNPILDKTGGLLVPRKSVVASTECFQAELDLVDIWRIKNPTLKSFTWNQRSPKIFCRLDYWLISSNLQDLVSSTCIIPAIKTDHLAITIEFCNKESEEKGLGLWKLNCSLLHNEDYVYDFVSKYLTWLAEGQRDLTDNRSVWEWIKYNYIRAHAIQHSKKTAKEKKSK